MIGYLMDTNHVANLSTKDQKIYSRVVGLPAETQIYACAITLGEIGAGHAMTATTNQTRRNEVIAFINKEFVPNSLNITHSTARYYGEIMGRLWKKYPPAKSSISTDAHLCNLKVNVNDIWIVASAWEHGLTLLTADQMAYIRSVVSTAAVTWDDWC
jgi:predicted nucleic acid-binding protein